MNRAYFLLAVLTLATTAWAQPARIGAAAAVRGRVEAVAPVAGAVGRIMESGKPVYLRDQVTTDAQGRMQVMLLDETVFTIGPNSSMVLDEFVYDPANAGAGKVTARVTKGVFRFVTGKVARETPSNMKVKLPVGVIGIRGTIVFGKIFSPEKATAILAGPGANNNANEKPGAMVVSAAGKESTASKPGTAIDATPTGPSAPYAAGPDLINAIAGELAPSKEESSKDSGGKGGGSASSGSGSTTDESGQGAAGALGDIANTASTSEVAQDNGQLTTNASQSTQGSGGLADGPSKWSDLATFGSGVGHFNQTVSNIGSCGGPGGCSGGINMSVCLYVDFAARQITSGSYVWIMDYVFSGSYINTSATFTSNFPFPSSGDAKVTFNDAGVTPYMCGGSGCSSFGTTTLTFMNSGGQPAKDMKVDLSFNDGTDTATASATFSR